MSSHSQEHLIEIAAHRVGYANGQRYEARARSLFNEVQLSHARVLDVGCGTGAWSLWTALHGAERVVAIEPEAHGATSHSLATLRQTIHLLRLDHTILASGHYLQELPHPERPFDVVVMYDVINHLDEEAVVTLHREQIAVDRYAAIFSNLRRHVRPGGWLIIADCARSNFWNRLGLRSPFARSIEWHKHQNPHVWIDILKKAGFERHDLQWSPLQPLVRLTSNWLVQYFTCSHFVLRCRAV